MTDADLLADQVTAELPPPATWTMPPRGYRQALGLCLIDAIARELAGDDAAEAMVGQARSRLGEAAEQAGVSALNDALVNAESSSHTLVVRAAALLTAAGIDTTSDLVAHLKAEGLNGPLSDAWTAAEGLTPRMWTNTAMLAGYMDPDVDRIIATYVTRAYGGDPTNADIARVIAALTEVAAPFESQILPLEFAILRHERP